MFFSYVFSLSRLIFSNVFSLFQPPFLSGSFGNWRVHLITQWRYIDCLRLYFFAHWPESSLLVHTKSVCTCVHASVHMCDTFFVCMSSEDSGQCAHACTLAWAFLKYYKYKLLTTKICRYKTVIVFACADSEGSDKTEHRGCCVWALAFNWRYILRIKNRMSWPIKTKRYVFIIISYLYTITSSYLVE